MLRINQIICSIDHTEEQLFAALCRKLKCRKEDILSWKIAKRSVDARKKSKIPHSVEKLAADFEVAAQISQCERNALLYSYTLLAECRDEEKLLKRVKKDRDIAKDAQAAFCFRVTGEKKLTKRPVIVGTGPAGLFCGLELARAGFRPILLERGKDVERRSADVEAFWTGGVLHENSNVQFGEGGAGTFSDGKLNTLVKDKYGRNTHVLETFVAFGAKESILYDQKPHLGTDALRDIVKNMRLEILRLGGEVRFESLVTDIRLSEDEFSSCGNTENGSDSENDITEYGESVLKDGAQEGRKKIAAVEINGGEWLETDVVVLAIGHSARDTFAMLYEKQLKMEAKPFAVGFRVQHPQRFINESQYGAWDEAECGEGNVSRDVSQEDARVTEAVSFLGAAVYKLTAKAKDGRGVYSFCMCPGGYVVNASSEKEHLAVNGMSYSGRDGENANSAVIVAVSPQDYGAPDFPLSGIAFQRELEQRAYKAGEGKIPVQKYRDFQAKLAKQGLFRAVFCPEALAPFEPALKGLYREADLTHILPPALNVAFVEGMDEMNRKLQGFSSGEVWLCGIESRTSSPVRICRDDALQSSVRGIYPCGEGAGYAGGITSAAMDGIRVAEEIAALYCV